LEKKKRKEELGVLGKRCGKKRRGWKSEEGEEMESSEHMHFDFDNHSINGAACLNMVIA
jgi:hypothetical protein